MEEEKDIKLEIILKTILLGILTIVISISILFILGVSKVDAAVTPFDTVGIREVDVAGNVNNFNTISSYPWQDSNQSTSGLSRRRYILYLTENGLTANMMLTFNVTLKATLIYSNSSGGVLNWDTTKLSYKIIGTDNRETNTSCEATQRLVQDYPTNTTTRKTYDIYINCNNITPSGNSKQVQIIYDYPSISGSDPRLLQQTLVVENVSQLTYEDKVDINVITSNNDANANRIMENNNYNTDRLHEDMNDIYDNMDRNTQREIDNYNERINQILTGEVWNNVSPDTSEEESLEGYEGQLADYMIDDTDITNLNFEVDTTSSQAIWQIFTNIIQSNTLLYTTLLTIMLLGIVKLILAR